MRRRTCGTAHRRSRARGSNPCNRRCSGRWKTRAWKRSRAPNSPACFACGCPGTSKPRATWAMASKTCWPSSRTACSTPPSPRRTPGLGRSATCFVKGPRADHPTRPPCGRWHRAWVTTSVRCGCRSTRAATAWPRPTGTTTPTSGSLRTKHRWPRRHRTRRTPRRRALHRQTARRTNCPGCPTRNGTSASVATGATGARCACPRRRP